MTDPATGDVSQYLSLITSEHAGQPKFAASVVETVQPLADTLAQLLALPALRDLDVAVGAQLDEDGLWIGASRSLSVPIAGVYFSLDTAGLGFDQGFWQGPGNPVTGLVRLPDEQYRTLLKARALNNHWDGTVAGAYAIWDALFAGTNLSVLIVDNGDLSMAIGIAGTVDKLTQALLTSGKLNIRPEGVRISSYFFASAPGPLFGFDSTNATFAGFDQGSWATLLPQP